MKSARWFRQRCCLWLTLVALLSCGGGESGGGGGDEAACSYVGVVIEAPTDGANYSASTSAVTLMGLAPLAAYWNDCYPCVPDTPGVVVDWENETTRETGIFGSWIETGWFLGYPLYSHHWMGDVLLTTGENRLVVSAFENATLVGRACLTITYVPDTTSPSTPANMTALATGAGTINVFWDAATDEATTDDAGVSYRVYRDAVWVASVQDTQWIDTDRTPDTQYCYTVYAVDTAGNVSAPSAMACALTPLE